MSVRVVARIRPLLEKELDKDIIVRPDGADPNGPHTIVKIPNPKNDGEDFSFAFNSVYGSSASQETLFTSEGTARSVWRCGTQKKNGLDRCVGKRLDFI